MKNQTENEKRQILKDSLSEIDEVQNNLGNILDMPGTVYNLSFLDGTINLIQRGNKTIFLNDHPQLAETFREIETLLEMIKAGGSEPLNESIANYQEDMTEEAFGLTIEIKEDIRDILYKDQ